MQTPVHARFAESVCKNSRVWVCGNFFQVRFAPAWFSPVASPLASMRGPDVATFRGLLPLAALMRSLFVKATGPNRTDEHKKKTMKKEQTQNQKSDKGSWPARTVGHGQSTEGQLQNESYSFLPTPSVSAGLKTTPTDEPCAAGFLG